MKEQGTLMELFASYQGEGVWAGVRQIFLRLGICHMRCAYCDTPDSWTAQKSYRVERAPHTQEFDSFDNPASVDQVLAHVQRLNIQPYHSISITGGEPLVQAEFLEALLPRLPIPVYLETSGTLSDKLEKVAPHVSFFSFDYKPPSTPGVKMEFADFERCIASAAGRPAQVKIVVMQDSPTVEEVERVCDLLRGKNLSLVFTPVTPVNAICRAPDGDRIKRLREAAERKGLEPYVIPQVHHLVGWL